MTHAGAALVLLLASAGPLLLPPEWVRAGFVPDFAALALVYVAFRGTPGRAALLGVALGFAQAPLRPEPATWLAFAHGTAGLLASHAAEVVDRDRAALRAAVAAGTALLLRAAAIAAAAVADTAPLGGAGVLRELAAAALCALVTAACAPAWFRALRRLGLLRTLERSFRDVRP